MEIIELLQLNTDKMDSQKNQCFQMRNWAIAIAAGVVTASYSIELDDPIAALLCRLALHVVVLLFLYFLIKWDKDWMKYFILFRERAVYLEELVLSKKELPDEAIKQEYFKYKQENKLEVEHEDFIEKNKKELRINIIYLLALGITVFSILINLYGIKGLV